MSAIVPIEEGTLVNTLLQTTPRERFGSISGNRRDYQDSWAFCKLLELHQGDADYLLVLDFHEDVLVVTQDGI